MGAALLLFRVQDTNSACVAAAQNSFTQCGSMQILSQICRGIWDRTICPQVWAVCSRLLLKIARKWWRIISARLKRLRKLEGKVPCNCCKYWFSLMAATEPLRQEHQEELHRNQTAVCSAQDWVKNRLLKVRSQEVTFRCSTGCSESPFLQVLIKENVPCLYLLRR